MREEGSFFSDDAENHKTLAMLLEPIVPECFARLKKESGFEQETNVGDTMLEINIQKLIQFSVSLAA